MNNHTVEDAPTEKLLADCMLGKLAKWLRLLGYDTVYIHDATDDELVRRAAQDGRTLLTKDYTLAGRRLLRGRCLLVTEEGTRAQLRQVVRDLALKVEDSRFLTRCPVCNRRIQDAPKESVREDVPPYVYRTQGRFGRCGECGRVYWRGTHVEHVLEALATQQHKGR